MSSSIVKYSGGRDRQGEGRREAEEEWVTTKKVEIVTTKNVERKIQRQVVLEDGRVVEEEIPTVTVDTTEDKQTFETDQDEERNLEGEGTTSIANRFDTSGGVLVGDKFTSTKKINDVRENLVKTEAMQDLGDIRSKVCKENARNSQICCTHCLRMLREFWRRGMIFVNILEAGKDLTSR